MKRLSYSGLPSFAITENATSPNPGYISLAWSTTINTVMAWNGNTWNAVDTGSVPTITAGPTKGQITARIMGLAIY